jgi:hypothetical protein
MQREHERTRFPLRGAHALVSCEGCHTGSRPGQLQFVNRSTTCFGCHVNNYRATTTPDHSAGHFSTECSSCHTILSWRGAKFDHSVSRFPLTGAHVAVTCQGCHADRVFRGKAMECAACHKADYDRAANPPHSGGFPTTCADCHGTSLWTGAKFDHDKTLFPLTGAHQAATCTGCHADKIFRGKNAACIGCHKADFDKTATPPHAAAGFSETCTACHSTTRWKGAVFDHATTRFPLTGGHRSVGCDACHADRVFRGKSTDCVACHRPDFDKTTNPPHAAASFSSTCTSCHTTAQWRGATYDHSVTRFPLTGAHKAVTCTGCHSDRVFVGKSSDCVSCHRTQYEGAKTPPHAGFPTTCGTCHSTAQWQGAAFDHAATRFALTGAHRATPCIGCHADGVFRGKATDCYACHQAKYATTKNPPHAAAGFSTTCVTCHTTTTWTGAVFDHNATRFPLTGAHRIATCAGCHSDGVYRGKTTDCYACHQAKYTATTNPPHAAAGFPTTCVTCHTTTQWTGAVFDHNATRFPLTGAHRATPCSGCHFDGVYRGKPTDCYSCHQKNYSATKNPPHTAAGFSTTCTTCHTTTQWQGAVFNHSLTRFPLTGAHATTPCLGCHSDGIYRGKTMDCYACHTTDYNNTTNPNHKAAQFPTTCASCHTTTRWQGATFNHDATFFPIYSGAHRGRWSTCSTCHTSPTNFAVFTCLSCHEHNQTDMDAKHRGRAGYRYDSASCYQCHPRGTH